MNEQQPAVRDVVARLPKTAAYKNQAKIILENEFATMSCAAIGAAFEHVDYDFPKAFQLLNRIQSTKTETKGNNVMTHVRRVFPQMPHRVKRVFIKTERAKKQLAVTEPALVRDCREVYIDGNDSYDIPGSDATDNLPPEILVVDSFDEANVDEKAVDTEANGLVECRCCYGDYPPQDIQECGAHRGHHVCKGCIYRYVSEQVDGNNTTNFRCIIDEKCGSSYHHVTVLEKILSPELKRRTNDAIYRDQVTQAGVEGQWTCQQCNNMGFLDQPVPSVFCPPCNVWYCTACHRPSHDNKTCAQMKAEEDRAKDPVHMAHEKMSEAVTRSCPSCRTKFVKHDGCNKMTCSSCGTKSCYLCGVEVADYSHFCDNILCTCGKCKLYTSTEDMEQRDRDTRHKAGREELEKHGMSPEEINKILTSPDAKKKAATTVPMPPAAIGEMPPVARAFARLPRPVALAFGDMPPAAPAAVNPMPPVARAFGQMPPVDPPAVDPIPPRAAAAAAAAAVDPMPQEAAYAYAGFLFANNNRIENQEVIDRLLELFPRL